MAKKTNGTDSSANGSNANREKTKAAQSREYHEAHPELSVQEIADALGFSYANVYTALGGAPKKRKKKRRRVSKVTKAAKKAQPSSKTSGSQSKVAKAGGSKANGSKAGGSKGNGGKPTGGKGSNIEHAFQAVQIAQQLLQHCGSEALARQALSVAAKVK